MNTANDGIARGNFVSPVFFALGAWDNIPSGAKKVYSVTTPSSKTLRLLRLQYMVRGGTQDAHSTCPLWKRKSRKSDISFAIVENRHIALTVDKFDTNRPNSREARNGILVNGEMQDGHLRLNRLIAPMSTISIEVYNHGDITLAFSGLLVTLGVDKC